ncbi:MAG: Abi-alpha family protein [Oceanococcus sp.]
MSQLEKAWPRPRLPGRLAAVRDLAARLPGADIAKELYQGIEDVAINELKHRLDAVTEKSAEPPETSALRLAQRSHPSQLLSTLLDEATEQNAETARRMLFTTTLMQLTPDEACMLAALSDGSEYAVVHVAIGNSVTGLRTVARNFCSLDRAAPVKLRDYVPTYVNRLLALGLAELLPENRNLEMKYQILEGNPAVLAVIEQQQSKNRNARCQRRSLKISNFGSELWRFCDPETANKHD